MSAATMVNDRFLRSGAEFGPANSATSNARRYNSHLLRGRDARANDFAARMLSAANSVPTKKKVGINTAFLRSGGEFRVATNVSPKIQRFEGMRTRGRDVRANAFAAKMLAGFAAVENNTADSTVVTVANQDFLRSGAQFRTATAASAEAKRFETMPIRGRDRRANEFAANMLAACQPPVSAPTPPAAPATISIANTAFLRSGGEFRVATNASPKLQRFEGMRTRGRDVRANAFAAKMLAAFETAEPVAVPEPEPTVPNIKFLRSGAEFASANNALADAKRFESMALQGRDARANAFAAKMLAAFEPAEPERASEEGPGFWYTLPVRADAPEEENNVGFWYAIPTTHSLRTAPSDADDEVASNPGFWYTLPATPEAPEEENNAGFWYASPTALSLSGERRSEHATVNVVNTAFLRSGGEFGVTNAEAVEARRLATMVLRGRDVRANAFAAKMLEALQPKPKPALVVRPALAATVANLSFLRTGGEFAVATNTMADAKRFDNYSARSSKNARLEAFHNAMLSAYSGKKVEPTRATSPRQRRRMSANQPAPTTTFNIEFLRTGAEFAGATASSPQVQRYEGFEYQSRNARLTRFHDRMLAAGRGRSRTGAPSRSG